MLDHHNFEVSIPVVDTPDTPVVDTPVDDGTVEEVSTEEGPTDNEDMPNLIPFTVEIAMAAVAIRNLYILR